MKKMLLAAAATIAMVASAAAQQTMDGKGDGTYERKYAFECVVTKVSPPDKDKDPAYKVNVWTNDKYVVRVAHTTASGAVYYRGEQYGDTNSGPMKNSFEDGPLMWWGRSKKHPEVTIAAWIGTLDGKLTYMENIFKGKASPFFGNSKAKPVTMIESVCHEVQA
jgi:hypothetical protein